MLQKFADFFLVAVCLPIGGMAAWVILTNPMASCTWHCRECDHTFEGNLVSHCPECRGVQVDRLDFHD